MARTMRTDNDYNHTITSGWSTSSDSLNITPTPSQGWFWAEPWSRWEHEAEADLSARRFEAFETDEAFLASPEEPRRYAQPLVVFWPLALGRWLVKKLWRR
jgi:hypothetical protein